MEQSRRGIGWTRLSVALGALCGTALALASCGGRPAPAPKAGTPAGATASQPAAPANASMAAAAAPAGPAASSPGAKKRDFLTQEARGLYVTSWIAGMKRFDELADLVDASELNTLVIDVKDCTGKVGYKSRVPLVDEIGAYERRIRRIDEVLAKCRERKIYTIARIAVFEDPQLAKAKPELAIKSKDGGIWKDHKGLSWVDPSSREVWEYNVSLAKEAAELGFDEVQFDYVRFPTDGKLKSLSYPVYAGDVPKSEVIRSFFEYLDRELKPIDVLVSADIFGLTMVVEDDLNIGQKLEDLADYVDFLCPMIYPSHFPTGHLGLKNPAEHPYRVIYDSCMRGLQRIEGRRAKLRPWLQDFKIGAPYGTEEILTQIQAARDAGVFGFCMWNARNVYTAEAYRRKFPERNPRPPLYESMKAELERRRQAKLAATQVKQLKGTGGKG
ncbi:MAG: putative glycoside hydrolase [Deltaproteobacteria bacterium]|nr:putative glycoside hydrolase [Deltaproteobacteria bacterium]